MADRPWDDEFTLLCERCGYVIEGLDTEGACPECGKAIAESLPERRVGTAWQQRPGVSSMIRTWAQSVRSPAGTVAILRSTPERGSVRLTVYTIATASLVASLGFVAPAFVSNPRALKSDMGESVAFILVFALAPFALLQLLTWIEGRGLRVIARSRRFRLGPAFARVVVAHASVGWIFSALGFAIASLASYALVRTMTPEPEPIGNEMLDSYVGIFNGPPRWVYFAGWGLKVLGVLPGFLFFETFAWLGLRRCKFANRARPPEPDAPERP